MSWTFTGRGDDYVSTMANFREQLKADAHIPPGLTRNIIEATAKVLALSVPQASLTAISCHGHMESDPDKTTIGISIATHRPDPVMGHG